MFVCQEMAADLSTADRRTTWGLILVNCASVAQSRLGRLFSARRFHTVALARVRQPTNPVTGRTVPEVAAHALPHARNLHDAGQQTGPFALRASAPVAIRSLPQVPYALLSHGPILRNGLMVQPTDLWCNPSLRCKADLTCTDRAPVREPRPRASSALLLRLEDARANPLRDRGPHLGQARTARRLGKSFAKRAAFCRIVPRASHPSPLRPVAPVGASRPTGQ
jgi:hypothetical protein